jgi:hypothetical protein
LKFLFVHQNFPAQFVHILRHLVAARRHEVVFISEPNANEMMGVRKVPYAHPDLDIKETHIAARELDNGVRRAEGQERPKSPSRLGTWRSGRQINSLLICRVTSSRIVVSIS